MNNFRVAVVFAMVLVWSLLVPVAAPVATFQLTRYTLVGLDYHQWPLWLAATAIGVVTVLIVGLITSRSVKSLNVPLAYPWLAVVISQAVWLVADAPLSIAYTLGVVSGSGVVTLLCLAAQRAASTMSRSS